MVPRHCDDAPGVFRVVPMIDDTHRYHNTRPYSTCLAMEVQLNVKDWRVHEIGAYRELFTTIADMGRAHAKRVRHGSQGNNCDSTD